jgi:phosphoenolpyruvate-protein phosphotransferase
VQRSGESGRATIDEAIAALALTAAQLTKIAAARSAAGATEESEIFSMQAVMASDPAFVAAIRDAALRDAANGGVGGVGGVVGAIDGVAALLAAGEAQAALLASLPDEYLAARAADVRDVASRAARILAGTTVPRPGRPVILVAEDLPPSISAEIPREHLLGIALRAGSRTAHAVILARSAGIPCIVAAAGLEVDGSLDGAAALLDGDAGRLEIAPSPERLLAAVKGGRERAARAAEWALLRGRRPQLAGGTPIHLLANIGDLDDARRAVEVGADGVGLLRTELLLLHRDLPPTEEEQVRAFSAIFSTFSAGTPITLRLADIGGDKPIPYLKIPHEENPFLGVRGYRLAMIASRPDLRALFASQVAAALRAAAGSTIRLRLMAPMVTVRAEVDDLVELVRSVRTNLRERGEAAAAEYPAEIGIMVEVPAAALTVATLAEGLDFVSIGTNDLTQYAMAADRVNPALSHLQDAAEPGVVALIQAIVTGARAAKLEVGVCGELAGIVSGAHLLTRLGIAELSMNPASIDEVRAALLR